MFLALATLLSAPHAPPAASRACVSLALTPAQQYAQQQQQMREARMRRIEAEEAAARGEVEPAPPPEDEGFKERFAMQLDAFDNTLFSPDEYSQRNQESRKDGYWAYVSKGEEPPLDATYGEFPLPLFSKLVDRACELRGINTPEERRATILADLGSGAGRLALWAAATSEWKRVVGVEYLPTLAATASAKLGAAQSMAGLLQTSDVQLVEGSWDDPLDLFDEIDVAFAYTTAITANDDDVLVGLSAALTQRLRRGTIVVTTDYILDPAGFEVLEKMEGANPGVGGISTGFIHRKTCAGERDVGSEDSATGVCPMGFGAPPAAEAAAPAPAVAPVPAPPPPAPPVAAPPAAPPAVAPPPPPPPPLPVVAPRAAPPAAGSNEQLDLYAKLMAEEAAKDAAAAAASPGANEVSAEDAARAAWLAKTARPERVRPSVDQLEESLLADLEAQFKAQEDGMQDALNKAFGL